MVLALRQSVATFRHDTWSKLAFVAFIYLDLALTVLAVNNGYLELNPLMASLLQSPLALVVAKAAAPLAVSWLVPGRLLIPSTLFMGVVVGWNVTQLGFGA